MESCLYTMKKFDRQNEEKQPTKHPALASDGWLAQVGNPALKNDRHRKERGGSAAFLTLFCSQCNAPLMLYQKDGIGSLQRCYLNRIFAPPHLEHLQHDSAVTDTNDLSALECGNCHAIVGVPMRHADGRLAFRLRRGAFFKKIGIQSSPRMRGRGGFQ